MNLKDVTSYIHEHIPITYHLGAEVACYDGVTVRVSAPLAPNLNHRNTVFGGSISALAILSGWTLLHLKMREEGLRTRLVIQKSSLDFIAPVAEDFEAACSMPEAEVWERFLKTLKKRGLARITMESRVDGASGIAATHEGIYVAVLLKDDETA